MPPLKTYIFESQSNDGIKITIDAYSFTQAMETLLSITRNIDDFRLMP